MASANGVAIMAASAGVIKWRQSIMAKAG